MNHSKIHETVTGLLGRPVQVKKKKKKEFENWTNPKN